MECVCVWTMHVFVIWSHIQTIVIFNKSTTMQSKRLKYCYVVFLTIIINPGSPKILIQNDQQRDIYKSAYVEQILYITGLSVDWTTSRWFHWLDSNQLLKLRGLIITYPGLLQHAYERWIENFATEFLQSWGSLTPY